MASSTILTSTWSHNCGMHVIADFMAEQIQKENDKQVFKGKAYDALLESFKKVYKQNDLTWEKIQAATSKASHTDVQIIWGYALRMMMPAVVESNQEYKQDLFNSFTAAIDLYKKKEFEELQSTYPIIFVANNSYLKAEALNSETNTERYLKYWNEKGFKDYCSALVAISEEHKIFQWLSKEELSIFCQYFNVEFDFDDQVDKNASLDPKKLYFSNSSGTHWERKIASSQLDPVLASSEPHSEFYNKFLDNDAIQFSLQAKVLGEIFFSDLYFIPEAGTKWVEAGLHAPLGKYFINNQREVFVDYLKSHKVLDPDYANCLGYFAALVSYDELMLWVKDPFLSKNFSCPYAQILRGALKNQTQYFFNQLLTDFPKEYSSSSCMPALILAVQQNNSEIAHQLLSRPGFDASGYMSKAISYVKPAFSHVLNQVDESGTPALYYAVKNIDIPLVKRLLEKGACATYEINGRVAFEWALDTANFDIIDLLINTVSPHMLLSLQNDKGNNCFHICFKNKALGEHLNKWIEIYLNHDHHNTLQDIFNSTNSSGHNVLHTSAIMGYVEGIEYCLEHQASLFSQDTAGNTALHLAAAFGKLEAVKFLVAQSKNLNDKTYLNYNTFDFNQKNKNKMSPLHLAQDNSHIEVAKYLKSIGCTDWVNDAYSELYLLCQQNKPDFDAFCLKNKDHLNTQGSRDFTLLHYICLFRETKEHTRTIIKKLIEHGARHQAVNHEWASPLHLAASHNNTDAIEELLAQGAFIDAINYQGMTACHYAVNNDAKDAFILLKNKRANLDLAAFAVAGIDSEPLTAVYLAGQLDGKIAEYLKPLNLLKKENTSDKPKVKFHSFEHRGIHWIENKLGLNHHYVSNLCSELHDLEGASSYQILSLLKVSACVGGVLMIGPSAAGIELVRQSILYANPTLKQKAGQIYYYIKPGIHNYNLPYASYGLDIATTGISFVYNGLFKTLNYLDLGNNFGRRVIGGGLGIGALKAAQKLGAKREAQAATLFVAREIGYFAVDAYHASSPERKAHQALMQYHVNPTLNQAFEIWGSILGKDLAERLILNAQFAAEFKARFYQSAGESERAVFDCIEGYVDLRNHLSNTADFAFNNRFAQFVLAPPQMLILEAELKVNAISDMTNRVLLGLEELIHTYLVPESEYQNLILHYAHVQKGLLIQNLKLQAEAQLKKAIESDNQQDITYYEEKIKAYNESILASEQSAKEHYEQTAKGKIANEYHAAQQKDFQSWSDARDVDNLKTLDPDTYFDQAYADFGNELSPEALSQYLISTFQMKKINFDDEAWEKFKLNLDASKMHDADFKQNLKSQWSTFAKTEIQNYLDETTPDVSSNNPELEKLINDFKPHATPEELRVLELNQKNDIKIEKYNIYKERRENQIHQSAITYAKYATYLISLKEYDDAQLNYILSQESLNNVQLHVNKKINELNDNKKLTEAERNEWLEEYNEYIDKAKAELIIKEEIFIQKQNTLQTIELDFSEKLTLLEKYQFKHFSKNVKENIELVSKINHAEIKNDLDKTRQEHEQEEKEKLQTEMNQKITNLNQLNAFTFDRKEMRELVGNALAESDYLSQVPGNIEKRLAQILPYPASFFKEKLKLSVNSRVDRIRGPGVSATKDAYAEAICKKLEGLDYEYFSYEKELLPGEIAELQNKISESNSRLDAWDKKISENDRDIQSLESQYVQKLAPEEQRSFQNKHSEKSFSNNTQNSNHSQKTNSLEKTIDTIIDEGFKKYPARNELSEFLADGVIDLKIQREGVTKTKKQMAIYRQLLIDEISTYHLSGYQRNTDRSKKRSYNFMYAEITGTEKKRHRHRWERIAKPVMNEIAAELFGGYRPYKDFKGGEDKKGQSGLQLTWYTDGRITFGIHKDNVPVWHLYDSAQHKRIIPEFSQPTQTPLEVSNLEVKKTEANLNDALPSEAIEPISYSSLNTDNKYVQPYLTTQHNQLCSTINNLGKTQEPKAASSAQHKSQKPAQPKAAQPKPSKSSSPAAKPDLPKPQTESKPASIPLEVKRPEAVTFSKPPKSLEVVWEICKRLITGENSPGFAPDWKRSNSERFPRWAEFTEAMDKTIISSGQLPLLSIEAAGETLVEVIETGTILTIFAAQEAGRGLRGEELKIVQALGILKLFVQEDFARAQLNEQTQTAKMALALVNDFSSLSKEERFKSFAKIFISTKTALAAANQLTRLGAQAAESGAKLPGVLSKTAVPATGATSQMDKFKQIMSGAPSKPLTSEAVQLPKAPMQPALPKGSQNLGELVPKPHNVSKVRVLNSAPEPFIKQFESKINPPHHRGKEVETFVRHPGPYAPNRVLPNKNGVGITDPEARGYPYTQLGIEESKRKYVYTKAREFDANGIAIRDIEFTDHRRKNHPNPHQHRWLPNETGGTLKRGDFEPLDSSLSKKEIEKTKFNNGKNRK